MDNGSSENKTPNYEHKTLNYHPKPDFDDLDVG